jgi:hypothetical protein
VLGHPTSSPPLLARKAEMMAQVVDGVGQQLAQLRRLEAWGGLYRGPALFPFPTSTISPAGLPGSGFVPLVAAVLALVGHCG